MPSRGKTSAFHPGPRSDLESHGFAPEFVPTAADQRLMLFTHIIRAFGITIALMVNAIIFIPFFVFGILPLLIRKRFGSSPSYPLLGSTNFNDKTERSQGISFSHDHHRTKSPNGDVSPLLLSADTSISDFAPYRERAATSGDVQEDLPRLPGPMIDFPSTVGGYPANDRPTIQVTRPSTPNTGATSNRSSHDSTKSDDGIEDTVEDECLVMKNTNSVDLLAGSPKFGSGHASGLDIPGHGQDTGGNTVMKREKTWENLQEAVYPTAKLL
jgi:hypothetical protein